MARPLLNGFLRHFKSPVISQVPVVNALCGACKAGESGCDSLQFSTAVSVVDMRSDTLTKPTAAMRKAMQEADVGDDVFGEDPTVNRFQEQCADMLGKEASLLVPTCTMANNIAVFTHCDSRFTEIILGDQSHMLVYEVASMAHLAGVQGHCIPNLPDGTVNLEDLEGAVRPLDDVHQPWTKLVCLENTHNKCGGRVLTPGYIAQVKEIVDRHKIPLHMDGARILNAATALGVDVREITKYCDTVSIAFSKGLCCPLGSVIAGSKDFISMSKRVRKALGGGMRQAGVVAAPMLLSLDQMIGRLAEDHQRAKTVALAIDAMNGNGVLSVDLKGVQSNIVMIDFIGNVKTDQFCQRMKEVPDQEKKSLGEAISVLMLPFSATKVRYVLHNDVSDADVDKCIKKLQYVVEEISQGAARVSS